MTAIKIEPTKITFTNVEDGLDANEYVPVIDRYNRRVDALAYARRLVE
jgi:hypothetical protein